MAVCTGFINPLDLECLFVNIFAGTPFIFGIAIVLFILGVGAYLRMPNAIIGGFFLLFGMMFSQEYPWIYLLSIVIGGILLAIAFVRAVTR